VHAPDVRNDPRAAATQLDDLVRAHRSTGPDTSDDEWADAAALRQGGEAEAEPAAGLDDGELARRPLVEVGEQLV
jgi:hypothetical protein